MTSKNNPFYPLQEIDDTIIYTQKRFRPRTPDHSPPPHLRNPKMRTDYELKGSDLNNMLKTFQNMKIKPT